MGADFSDEAVNLEHGYLPAQCRLAADRYQMPIDGRRYGFDPIVLMDVAPKRGGAVPCAARLPDVKTVFIGTI